MLEQKIHRPHTHTHTNPATLLFAASRGVNLTSGTSTFPTHQGVEIFPHCNSVNDAEVLFLAHKVYLFCNIAGTVW